MNNFINKKKITNPSNIIEKNYGLSFHKYRLYALKNNFSKKQFNNSINIFFSELFEQKSQEFNRLFRFNKKKQIESLRKQSSWRSLRLRQGLPVNGQRTHSNARNSKKLNSSINLYDL